jgi:hypothetical protein
MYLGKSQSDIGLPGRCSSLDEGKSARREGKGTLLLSRPSEPLFSPKASRLLLGEKGLAINEKPWKTSGFRCFPGFY